MLGSGSAPAGAKGTRDNEISEPTMETLNGVGREAGEMLGAAGGHRIDRPQTQPARLRCLSNLIHDRIWAHLVTLIASNPGTSIKDKGATREIVVGAHLRLRIKRHHAGDEISTYPTRTAIEFWQQGSQPAFPGLEEVRIAVGYRWDPDTREIGAPLLSLRDGKDHVIWVVELDEPAAGVKITWTPIEPTLPSIDFGDLGEDSGASGER